MKTCLVTDDQSGWCNFHVNVLFEYFGSENIQIDKASSAAEAYSKVIEHEKTPYDIVITDLQMETDYEPKYAGEWLVEQIKTLPNYYKTKIIIVSASYNIKNIADNLGVLYLPKSAAIHSAESYKEILQ